MMKNNKNYIRKVTKYYSTKIPEIFWYENPRTPFSEIPFIFETFGRTFYAIAGVYQNYFSYGISASPARAEQTISCKIRHLPLP